MKKSFLLLCFVSLTIGLYSQNTSSAKAMAQKIDSIAKVNDITKCEVKMNYVTTTMDKTQTEEKQIVRSKKTFKFDGEFLVFDDTYFNLNKLLYFTVKRNEIEFFFQGY